MSDVLLWSFIAFIVGIFYYVIGDTSLIMVIKIWIGFTALISGIGGVNAVKYHKSFKVPLLVFMCLLCVCVYVFVAY